MTAKKAVLAERAVGSRSGRLPQAQLLLLGGRTARGKGRRWPCRTSLRGSYPG